MSGHLRQAKAIDAQIRVDPPRPQQLQAPEAEFAFPPNRLLDLLSDPSLDPLLLAGLLRQQISPFERQRLYWELVRDVGGQRASEIDAALRGGLVQSTLSAPLRQTVEELAGESLGPAQLVSGEAVDRVAARLGKVAFTLGREMFVSRAATGRQEVLLHEGLHAVQQSAGGDVGRPTVATRQAEHEVHRAMHPLSRRFGHVDRERNRARQIVNAALERAPRLGRHPVALAGFEPSLAHSSTAEARPSTSSAPSTLNLLRHRFRRYAGDGCFIGNYLNLEALRAWQIAHGVSTQEPEFGRYPGPASVRAAKAAASESEVLNFDDHEAEGVAISQAELVAELGKEIWRHTAAKNGKALQTQLDALRGTSLTKTLAYLASMEAIENQNPLVQLLTVLPKTCLSRPLVEQKLRAGEFANVALPEVHLLSAAELRAQFPPAALPPLTVFGAATANTNLTEMRDGRRRYLVKLEGGVQQNSEDAVLVQKLPRGGSRLGSWMVWTDGESLQLKKLYPEKTADVPKRVPSEDPSKPSRAMAESSLWPGRSTAEKYAESGVELNRDLESAVARGMTLEQATKFVETVHRDLLIQLVQGYVNAFSVAAAHYQINAHQVAQVQEASAARASGLKSRPIPMRSKLHRILRTQASGASAASEKNAKQAALRILGFPEGSSPSESEIKTAYRGAYKAQHDDVVGGETEEARRIGWAKSVLVSPEESPLRQQPAPSWASGTVESAPVESMRANASPVQASGAPAEFALERSTQAAIPQPVTPAIKVPRSVLPVPQQRQQVNFSCGTVSAQALLRYWKGGNYNTMHESELYKAMGTTPENGTEPDALAAFFNRIPGMHAEFRCGQAVTTADLEAAVDRGEPPIVNIQAWQDAQANGVLRVDGRPNLQPWEGRWDDGHYVVLIGYDEKNYYFMDPSTDDTYAHIPKEELVSRWHDVLNEAERVQHMTVFVGSRGKPAKPAVAAPTTSTPID